MLPVEEGSPASADAFTPMSSGTSSTHDVLLDDVPPSRSPMWRVVGNYVNTVVGAGIVGLPFTLKRAGFWCGLVMMGGACVMTHYSVRLLVRTAIRLRVNTYERLCELTFGPPGYYAAAFALLVFDYGACLSYLIILADSASRAVEQAFPSLGNHDGVLHDAVLLVSAPLLLVLVLQRDLSALERFSFLSVALVSLLVAFVVWSFRDASLGGGEGSGANAPLPLYGGGFASAFGTIAFSFVNNDVAFLLYNTLQAPSEVRWARLSTISLGLAFLICGLFATFGYLTFGDAVSDNLLNDYPARGLAILIMRSLYALTMLLTFPTTFFVVRHVCNELLFSHREDHMTVQGNTRERHLLLSLPIFASCVALAVARVTLGFVMSFTGGFAAVLLAFVFPPASWIKSNPWSYSPLVWRNHGRMLHSLSQLGPAMLMLAFGLVACIATPVQSAVCEFAPDGWPGIC